MKIKVLAKFFEDMTKLIFFSLKKDYLQSLLLNTLYTFENSSSGRFDSISEDLIQFLPKL